MVIRLFRAAADWIQRVINHPMGELTRWQRFVRFCYDLGTHGARQLIDSKAPVMAAALAFRTLFGMLPVLVVATILVRALNPDRFSEFLRQMVEMVVAGLGLEDARLDISAAGDGAEKSATLEDWFVTIAEQVNNINVTAISWIGVLVLIYSALSLIVTIENSFNTIYRAPQGRPWTKRVLIYWFVLTVAPLAIGATIAVDKQFDRWLGAMHDIPLVLSTAPILWSFAATWLLIFSIYKFVPNTQVAMKPALTGAFIAALLMEIGKRTMGAYLENAVSLRQLYGQLGLIPLFMFWIYLMWMVLLYGLEVSSTLQELRGRRIKELEPKRPTSGVVDPAAVLVVMKVIADRFNHSLPTTTREITAETAIPEDVVARMVERLVEKGVLHRLEREEATVSLARPPEQISGDLLVEVGYALADTLSRGQRPALLDRLREAQKKLAGEATLASLLAPVSGANQAAGA